jgi:hypothetical protein
MLGYSAGPMTDRDHLEPVDPAGPRKRLPGARALGSVSDALARIVPRPRSDDRSSGDGAGVLMSDEELREAFRLASLTVTPAPLGRPSRRPGASTSDDEANAGRSDGPGQSAPGATEHEASESGAAAATGRERAVDTHTSAVERPGSAAAPSPPSTAIGPGGRPASAWAPAPSDPPSTGPTRASEVDPADAVPASGLPSEPGAADPVQLPGNLAFSVDDFFGGLVRRIERRP